MNKIADLFVSITSTEFEIIRSFKGWQEITILECPIGLFKMYFKKDRIEAIFGDQKSLAATEYASN